MEAGVVKHGGGVEELLVDFGADDDTQCQPEAERPPAVVEEHGRQPTVRGLLGASSEHGARWLEALRRHEGVTAGVQVQRSRVRPTAFRRCVALGGAAVRAVRRR